MSKLEDLEQELYGSDESGLQKRTRSRIFVPADQRKLPTGWTAGPAPVSPSGGGSGFKYIKFLLAGGAALFIVGGALFLFFYLGTRGKEAAVEIQGRDQVESGELVRIPVIIRNTSSVALRDGELALLFPRGTTLVSEGAETVAPPRLERKLDPIPPGETDSVEVVARLYGREGEGQPVEAIFVYRPENLNARFSVNISKTLTIGRVPLAVSWDIPETLSQGQEVELKVHYISSAQAPFRDLSFRVEYPPGFSFVSATPAPEIGENLWHVGDLDPHQEGIITIRGKIVGEEGEVKAFQGGIGVFDPLTKDWRSFSDSSRTVKIAVTPIAIEGFLNHTRDGLLSPGDRIEGLVRYKNNTSVSVQNVVIRAFLESFPSARGAPDARGGALDFSTLQVRNGAVFDAASRAIVWAPGGVPSLGEVRPGEGGEFGFSIQLRSQPLVRSEEDKNWIVQLRSQLEVAAAPQELAGTNLNAADRVRFRLRSKLLLSGRILYHSAPIPNSGPIPPKADAKTTYSVVWEIRNFTNDVNTVELRLSLPPNVKWENVRSPQDARMTFDGASGEVRWVVGELKAGTGILRPALVGAFQISIVPAETDVGKPVILVTQSRFTGTDSFTGEKLDESLGAFSTELRLDPESSPLEWSVAR